MRAVNRYADAYKEMNVDALKKIFPSLPRETSQAIASQFRNCLSYDATFLSTELLVGNESSATVNARTTYTCQPKTRQKPQPQTVVESFQLRKLGDEWFIDQILTGDPNKRR